MTGTVLTALGVERTALRRHLGQVPVTVTGIGAGRLPATLSRADAVLRAGVGGGLDLGVRPRDLVVATEVRTDDGRAVPCPSGVLLAGALRRAGLATHLGPLHASERLVVGNRRGELADTGALAVDMESGRVAAKIGGQPLAVVRAIVDTADAPLFRAGTPVRGVRGLAALRAAGPVVAAWVAATGARDVLLAGPRSFCAGVERAIEIVERALDRFGPPVYVRRQIVHNGHVVRDLERRGAVFVAEVDDVPEGARVVLAAHGVSPAVRADAATRRLDVIDATCPLVSKVHAEVRRYAGAGSTVFVIGHGDHEEVQGTMGEAPDQVLLVSDPDEAARVQPRDPAKVSYVMQTTLAVDEAEQVAEVLRARFPALRAPRNEDICYATTNRQSAVRQVARRSDLVLVLGSPNSSNSLRLVEVAEREGTPAYLVDDVGEVDLGWLAGTSTVGVTAGASAPPRLVDEVVHALGGLGHVTAHEAPVTEEDVVFALPKEVM